MEISHLTPSKNQRAISWPFWVGVFLNAALGVFQEAIAQPPNIHEAMYMRRPLRCTGYAICRLSHRAKTWISFLNLLFDLILKILEVLGFFRGD